MVVGIPRILAASLCLAGICSASAQGAAFDPHVVPADAQWYFHVDVDLGHQSPIWNKVRRAIFEYAGPAIPFELFKEKLHFEPSQDLHGITRYGQTLGQAEGVMVIAADMNQEAVVQVLEKKHHFARTEHGSREIYSWVSRHHGDGPRGPNSRERDRDPRDREIREGEMRGPDRRGPEARGADERRRPGRDNARVNPPQEDKFASGDSPGAEKPAPEAAAGELKRSPENHDAKESGRPAVPASQRERGGPPREAVADRKSIPRLPRGPEQAPQPMSLAFAKPGLLVVGHSAEAVQKALDVIDGKTADRASVSADLPAAGILSAYVSGLADAKLPLHSPLLKHLRQLTLNLSDADGKLVADAQLRVESDQVADKVRTVAEGFRAMDALQSKEPKSAGLFDRLETKTKGDVVTVQWTLTEEQALQLKQKADEMRRHARERWVAEQAARHRDGDRQRDPRRRAGTAVERPRPDGASPDRSPDASRRDRPRPEPEQTEAPIPKP